MNKKKNFHKIINPHDKMIKETLSNRETAATIFRNNLPDKVLGLMDLATLEICKDSFIEKELSDYYSDMLYKVMLSGTPGYVYILFEHKSYYDRYVHLQLLEYMVKIWRLFIKQQKKNQIKALPIVIPLLISHGKRSWPENSDRLSFLLDGPVEELFRYIPDFKFELYDLSRFTDEEIKGTVMARVMLLLLKHISDPDIVDKLPDILALMKELMEKETGLQYFETVLRYLFSTIDNVSAEKIKEIAEQAISQEMGGYIMTLAEKFRKEGEIRGEIRGKLEGKLEGLSDAIELGMTLKFPDEVDMVMVGVRKIKDIEALIKIKEAIKTVTDGSEILLMIDDLKK